MLEMAAVAHDIHGPDEADLGALTCSEQRLIKRFRHMSDQEQHQVLRLLEVLHGHPVKAE
ncbi:hypothetical protein N015_01850 [Pseudomonas asturiensis]|uniref:DNA-binding transcriptional regulator, MarR family n=1 Tax=Pseudomonas asturiensis TaxID=1190415 RepID=A0ABX6H6X9_9PSED|nr:hypothetical protein [Pseudomonas asturiensis]QHF01214.1 hypothetical protein N015_01850 [Pseudomonas asturiensis]